MRHHCTLDIEHLQFALVRPEDQLPMILIKGHLSDITVKNVFDYADRLSSLGIPNFNRSVTRHEYFQAFLREHSLANRVVV